MCPEYTNIMVDVSDGVSTILVNRPPLNILDQNTLIELQNALQDMKDNEEANIILLKTAGDRFFSVGVDVEQHLPEHAPKTLEVFNKVFEALLNVDKPVIAVVQGPALGVLERDEQIRIRKAVEGVDSSAPGGPQRR